MLCAIDQEAKQVVTLDYLMEFVWLELVWVWCKRSNVEREAFVFLVDRT